MIAAKYLEHRTADCDAVGYLDRAEPLPSDGSGSARVRLTGWCFCSGCGAPHALRFRSKRAAAESAAAAAADAADEVAEVQLLAPVRRDDVVACYDGRAQLAWCGFDQEVRVPAAAAAAECVVGTVELADGAASSTTDPEAFWSTVFEPQVRFAAHHLPAPALPEQGEMAAAAAAAADSSSLPPVVQVGEAMVAMASGKSWGDDPVVIAKLQMSLSDDAHEQRESTYFDDFAPRVATRAAPTVMAIDGVYFDPLAVRAFALSQEFRPHPEHHRGERTDAVFLFPGLRELVERRLGVRVSPERWAAHPSNGCFQWCRAGDPVVLHSDFQRWAGVLFLTPDAPVQCGTSLHRPRGEHWDHADATRVQTVDAIGNVFNRLVLFDARTIHSATQYFGSDKHNARLFQMFFFDAADDDVDNEEEEGESSSMIVVATTTK